MSNRASHPRTSAAAPGNIALDAEREASMADEGGVSAALLDIEDVKEQKARHPGTRVAGARTPWILAGLAGAFSFHRRGMAGASRVDLRNRSTDAPA